MMSQRDLCTCETQPTENQSTIETEGIWHMLGGHVVDESDGSVRM
jgi:hypothetical protein